MPAQCTAGGWPPSPRPPSSTYALDAVATAAGVAAGRLARSWAAPTTGCCSRSSPAPTSPGPPGLRVNLAANWTLLEETGTSTNALSKAALRPAPPRRSRAGAPDRRRRSATSAPRSPRRCPTTPAPSAPRSSATRCRRPTRSSSSAARTSAPPPTSTGSPASTRAFLQIALAATPRSTPTGCRREYLADYYSAVEPDERETIAFFVDAMRDVRARRADPVLRRRADAPPRVPRRRQGVRDPPGRLPAGEPRRDPSAGSSATPTPTTGAPFVRYTLECEGLAAPTDARDPPARGAHAREDHAPAPGRRRPPAAAARRATRRSSAPTARTPRPPTGPRGRPTCATSPASCAPAARSSPPRCAARRLPRRRQAVPERERRRARHRAVLAGGSTPTVEVRELAEQESHGYAGVVLARARRAARPG